MIEQHEADLETLGILVTTLALNPDAMVLPSQSAALARQLPAMLAALRFVEEHGEAVYRALASEHGACREDCPIPATLEALAALRVR